MTRKAKAESRCERWMMVHPILATKQHFKGLNAYDAPTPHSNSNSRDNYEELSSTGSSLLNPPIRNPKSHCSTSEGVHTTFQGHVGAGRSCNFEQMAWAISNTPLRAMGMTLPMLFISGSNAGIFSILIVTYSLVNAIKVLARVNKNFVEIERARGKQFVYQKLVYCLYSLMGIAFILFKLGTMGLIPVNRGDFFSETPSHSFESHAQCSRKSR